MNKIGLHITGGTSVPLGKPKFVKLVDPSIAYVSQVRAQVGANCLIDVRFTDSTQTLSDPVLNARAWFYQHIDRMQAMNAYGPITFEGYNEIGDADAVRYAIFEVERLRLMHAKGLNGTVLDCSVGTPGEKVWVIYKKVLDAMGPKDFVGLHEYWSDRADITNRWHVGRFTLPTIAPYLVGKNILITEAGRDYTSDTKQGKPGWQLTCNAGEFLGDLQRVDDYYASLPQVHGWAVFQTGSIDPRWKPFDVGNIWPQVAGSYPQEVSVPQGTYDNPIQEPLMPIDGRCMDAGTFADYLQEVTWGAPRTSIYLHHTWKPTPETWAGRATIDAMRRTYGTYKWQDSKGLWHAGWSRGPHLFIAPDGIWLFYDLTKDGYHAGGNYNVGSIGVEVVGDYDNQLPSGKVLENTVAALKALFRTLKLNPQDIRFHRDVSTKTCPGTAITKPWIIDLLKEPELPYLPHIVEKDVWNPLAIIQKSIWWSEERRRCEEKEDYIRADTIDLSLIDWLYSREARLKEDA